MRKISYITELETLIDTKAVTDYIYERQNDDGGYTFCRQTESSAQDTYYATEILKILDIKSKNLSKTITFLKSLQHKDERFDSIKVAYYVLKTLTHLGSTSIKPIHWLEHSKILINGLTKDTYIEVASEIEDLHIAVELLNSLNLKMNKILIIEQVLKLQNNDGSYGSSKYSKIASTYHALAILNVLGYHDVEIIHRASDWIRHCESPSGGFVGEPDFMSAIYLDETYFGVKILEVLEEKQQYPKETLKLIPKFQNSNGGFRRSVFLGLSEFESTYHALSIIETTLDSKYSARYQESPLKLC